MRGLLQATSLLLHRWEPHRQGAHTFENSWQLQSGGQRLPVGLLSLSANSKPVQAQKQLPSRHSSAQTATLQHHAIMWLNQQQVEQPTVTSSCDKKACSDGAALNFKQWLSVKQVWCSSGSVTKPSSWGIPINNPHSWNVLTLEAFRGVWLHK